VVRINTLVVKTLGYTEDRHEGLYVEIEDMVIRSDELPNSQKAVSRLFGDTTVVLCTLATLSNPKLNDCGLFRAIPVRSLVIDEASQIDVFEFMVIVPVLVSVDKIVTF
jgi:regulator of nonsense transcripts 1